MIPDKIVTETWQRMAQTPHYEVPQLIEQMKDEQPVMMAYLLDLEDYPFNQYEREIIFYIGMVIWQIMKQSNRRLRKVTRKKMERAIVANDEFLSYLESDTEADFYSATKTMLEKCPEPEVLGYILEALMEEESYESDEPPIRDEYRGLAFIHLKTALDAFIGSLA